jgi:guanine deaminase
MTKTKETHDHSHTSHSNDKSTQATQSTQATHVHGSSCGDSCSSHGHSNSHSHDQKHSDKAHGTPSKNGSKAHTDKGNPEHMRRAIELSRRASIIEKSGGVFGAVIVNKEGKIIGEGYNQVVRYNDPTWHAEIQAIREACKKAGSPHLEGCTLYTSAECCPMCLAAAYWAHIDHIYVGASIQDSLKYGDFADVDILEQLRLDPKDRRIGFTELLRHEAVEVWKEFSELPDRARY